MNKKRERPPESYLIDMCQRGNAIRLYFGGALEVITGDDWDDVPYESNADIVYPEFVDYYIDVLIPFYWRITDYAGELDMYTNSRYCRNDFKKGEIAILWCIDQNYERENVYFYMGDTKKNVTEKLNIIGATSRIIKKEE